MRYGCLERRERGPQPLSDTVELHGGPRERGVQVVTVQLQEIRVSPKPPGDRAALPQVLSAAQQRGRGGGGSVRVWGRGTPRCGSWRAQAGQASWVRSEEGQRALSPAAECAKVFVALT